MYCSTLNPRDRGGAVAAALLIQVALLIAFLNMGQKFATSETQVPLHLVDVPVPTAPPPPPKQKQAVRQKAGGSPSKNLRSDAASVVLPKTPVEIPRKEDIPVALTPANARDRNDGRSNLPGPGRGSGGTGSGNGSGAGTGPGDGGLMVEPPHLATPVLSSEDFPREMIEEWPRSATVFLRLRIDPRGFVSECTVDRGTNMPAIDSQMCNTAHERLRFRPALNRSGQAVAGWFGYAQPAPH
jgi:protein TonB